jgi:hypothetical protein
LLAVGDLDERDLVLGAQGNDELLVCLLLARLIEDAHVGLATVEGLGGLAQTAGESVVDESELEDTLEGLEHAHLALTGGCIGRNLDLGGRADLGLGIVFSVRLLKFTLVTFLKCDGGVMMGAGLLFARPHPHGFDLEFKAGSCIP